MKTQTISTTSDGREFVDDETGARAHQDLLDRIERFCEARDVPHGRGRNHYRNVIVGWVEFVVGEVRQVDDDEVDDDFPGGGLTA